MTDVPLLARQQRTWEHSLQRWRAARAALAWAFARRDEAERRYDAAAPPFPSEPWGTLDRWLRDPLNRNWPVFQTDLAADIHACLSRQALSAEFDTWNREAQELWVNSGVTLAESRLHAAARRQARAVRQLMRRKAPNLLAVAQKLSTSAEVGEVEGLARAADDLLRLGRTGRLALTGANVQELSDLVRPGRA